MLVVLAHIVVLCVDCALPAVGELWGRLVPFDYSGTFLLSAALGIALPTICNSLYGKERAALRAAASYSWRRPG